MLKPEEDPEAVTGLLGVEPGADDEEDGDDALVPGGTYGEYVARVAVLVSVSVDVDSLLEPLEVDAGVVAGVVEFEAVTGELGVLLDSDEETVPLEPDEVDPESEMVSV